MYPPRLQGRARPQFWGSQGADLTSHSLQKQDAGKDKPLFIGRTSHASFFVRLQKRRGEKRDKKEIKDKMQHKSGSSALGKLLISIGKSLLHPMSPQERAAPAQTRSSPPSPPKTPAQPWGILLNVRRSCIFNYCFSHINPCRIKIHDGSRVQVQTICSVNFALIGILKISC